MGASKRLFPATLIQFCTVEDKRLIMIVAGILSGRVLNRMQKAWKAAVFGVAMVFVPVIGTAVFAEEAPPAETAAEAPTPAPFPKAQAEFIKYGLFQNELSPVYFKVFQEMKPLYKGSRYDLPPEYPQTNPLIGIGEFDLNNDKIPEVIAFPTEDEVEAGKYCKADSVCPHYILDISGDKPVLLGKIFASSLDRGAEITNGHWDLKAYTHDWTIPRTDESVRYVYDKNTKSYKAAEPAPAPEK